MDYSKLLEGPNGTRPLYGRLIEALESAIYSGELPMGLRLPSERELAAQLGVSRTTVINAYRELEARGLVRGHVGRGTFVCATLEPEDASFAWRGKVTASGERLGTHRTLRHMVRDSPDRKLISFAAGSSALEFFPIEEYRRLADKVLKHHTAMAIGYGPTEGQLRLRQVIGARYGIRPEKIIILSGSQQGLDLIARCLIAPGDAVILDRPGYIGAIQTFRSAGANLIGWDVKRADPNEMEDLILRYRPKFIYTNPTFQNPTGHLLSVRDRQELLKLAARYRIQVIEDDPYRELYLGEPPPQSLYSLDEYNVVIYLNTFSKVAAPGLRLSWLAASEFIVDQLASIKQRENVFTEGPGQLIMAEFLQCGLMDEHVATLRREHKKKLNATLKALAKYITNRALSYDQPQGGLYLWCRLKGSADSQQVFRLATQEGVAFAPGEVFYADRAGGRELRLCFSRAPLEVIEEGVRRLAKCLGTDSTIRTITLNV